MKVKLAYPVFDRDQYYDASSRTIRWVCLLLVLISYPFSSSSGLIVLTLVAATTLYNALRYVSSIAKWPVFTSKINSLAVDHIFVLSLVLMSGGFGSPYYPFFFLLIIAILALYGVAGFAFSLGAQVLITLILSQVSVPSVTYSPQSQLIIKIIFLIVFSMVAEQSVRSRDEESLLETRFAHKVENERQRLLSLINSLTSAVLAVDQAGKIYLYNGAALELLNTNREVTGLPLSQLLPLETADGQPVDVWRLANDQAVVMSRQDLLFAASDKTKLNLDLTISPVRVMGDGRETNGGYMIVFRDITKQKSLDEQRDEFISVASHELRTPLAIAEANLSTAMMPNFAKIDPKALNLLNQAHDNIVFLGELIHDLTTLSRAERGDLKIEDEIIDGEQLVEDLVRDYRAQASEKGLKLTQSVDAGIGNIVTGQHEVREILQNFLTNAIKYTEHGTITLKLTRATDGVVFSVKDSGIGISASDKAHVFGKFYRSEDYRTRQTGGTGLGLYITRKLADRLGAEITFTSRLNHGSTFSLHIPQAKATSGAPSAVVA